MGARQLPLENSVSPHLTLTMQSHVASRRVLTSSMPMRGSQSMAVRSQMAPAHVADVRIGLVGICEAHRGLPRKSSLCGPTRCISIYIFKSLGDLRAKLT